MIFVIKEKWIILTHNVLLAIATNIPVLLMTAFVLQGHIWELHNNNESLFSNCKWNHIHHLKGVQHMSADFSQAVQAAAQRFRCWWSRLNTTRESDTVAEI